MGLNTMRQSDGIVGLAPMEGITDFPMRLWFALTSQPGVCSSPFLRVTDTFPHLAVPASAYWPELGYAKGYVPYEFVPQLMASSLEPFIKTSEHVLKESPTVELNCGCPAPTVVGHHAGSSLLREVDRFALWLERSETALGADHIRIKMRTGFADAAEFPPLLGVLGNVRLRRLTVHGRTRKQHYTGVSAWDLIQSAAERLPTPIIGSGDILSWQSFETIKSTAPLIKDFVIGRGASRNPWIFEELRSGVKLRMTRNTLVYALQTYAILHLIASEAPERLVPLVKSGLFLSACKNDEAAWSSALNKVARAWDERVDLQTLELPRKALGRVKMVWTYLRTSIGGPAMNPLILRAQTLPAFISLITDNVEPEFFVGHNAEFDYLFAGAVFKD